MSNAISKKLASATKYEVVSGHPGYDNLVIESGLKQSIDIAMQKRDRGMLKIIFEHVKDMCRRKEIDPRLRETERVSNPAYYWDLLYLLAKHTGNGKIANFVYNEYDPRPCKLLVDGEKFETTLSFVKALELKSQEPRQK